MVIPSGLGAQLGVVVETTYGTPVTVTKFYEFNSESLKLDINRIESAGLRAGTRRLRSDRWVAGSKNVSGDIAMEIQNKGFGYWLQHMIGPVATTGPTDSNYSHLFVPGDLPVGLTVQVGRPDFGGTARAFTYHGCHVAGWEISCGIGEIPILRVSLVGEDEDVATGLASASYASSTTPFTFVTGTFTIEGSAANISSFSLQGENPLTERRVLGSALRKAPLENGFREYTGSFDAEFTSLTQYGYFTAGTIGTLALSFTGPVLAGATASSLTIAAEVRFDGDTPNVGGPEEIRQPLNFKVVDDSVAANFGITYVTTDTAP